MERLLLIACIGTCTSLLLGALRREYAVFAGIATAALLLLAGLDQLTLIRETVQRIADVYGVPSALLLSVSKIVGLAYLTEFGVNLCRDAGQTAIAGNLEFGGKALILACALPALTTLIETGAALLKEAIS